MKTLPLGSSPPVFLWQKPVNKKRCCCNYLTDFFWKILRWNNEQPPALQKKQPLFFIDRRRDQKGNTSLHRAAKAGNWQEINNLIEGGLEINATNQLEKTPLHKAASKGHSRAVRSLIRHGANKDAATVAGEKPIHLAARSGDIDSLALLLNEGQDIDVQSGRYYNTSRNRIHGGFLTPLQVAVEAGQLEAAEFLIQRGAKLDVVTKGNNTLLHSAAQAKSIGIVRLLLKTGNFDVNAKNIVDYTAMDYALSRGNLEMVQILTEAGANLFIQSNHGNTVLHTAAQSSNRALIQFLLSKGLKKNAVNRANETPLFRALESK